VGRPGSLTGFDSRVRAVLLPPEKPDIHEFIEEHFTGRGIQTPQSLDLFLGQAKTGDLQILFADHRQPVRDVSSLHLREPGM
jgi:hypothetical protein